MSGATSIFKMPAAFARDNYPIVRDEDASPEQPARRVAAAGTSNKGISCAGLPDEHVVVTEFKSVLGGGGARRAATA